MLDEKNVLPSDFDGVFRFTNYTDSEFKAKWDNVEYTFPANKTSPMIIPGATPEQVQNIRKKFARELAIQEWYKTPKFQGMNVNVPGGSPALYTDSDIAPFVQRCLEALPIAQAKAQVLPRDSEERYRKNVKGKNVSRVVGEGDSLVSEAEQGNI